MFCKKVFLFIFLIMITAEIPDAQAGFKGKVIDAETNEPIEGVVVMLKWFRNHAWSGSDYFQSRETKTDKDGMFDTWGRWKINFIPWTWTPEPTVLIFKVGYEHFDQRWLESVFKKERMQKWISYEGDLTVFKLKKLVDVYERRRNIPYVTDEIPRNKRKLMMEEINKEEKLLDIGISKY